MSTLNWSVVGRTRRRRYLDFLGLQIDNAYRPALRAYERALRARNALLKSPTARPREIAAYDAPLIQHGQVLLRLRAELSELLAPLAAHAYRRISTDREKFTFLFVPGASADFEGDLERSHHESIRLRQTIVGPHRDDLELRVDNFPAAQFGSEGQQRSIVLAMKIAQAEVLEKIGRQEGAITFDRRTFLASWIRNAGTLCWIVCHLIRKSWSRPLRCRGAMKLLPISFMRMRDRRVRKV